MKIALSQTILLAVVTFLKLAHSAPVPLDNLGYPKHEPVVYSSGELDTSTDFTAAGSTDFTAAGPTVITYAGAGSMYYTPTGDTPKIIVGSDDPGNFYTVEDYTFNSGK